MNGRALADNNTRSSAEDWASAYRAPAITLPKGGGAIQGIDEKFSTNAATGTGALCVPIAVSPGRSGFTPSLALSYDSGAGNGPFGLGWQLSLPSITRKTDKGLPDYRDTEESDVFIFAGHEDLVPVDEPPLPDRVLDTGTYRIRRYRPRVEDFFARIERWTRVNDAADVFWRTISPDNITTWYGRTPESRIFDPAAPAHIYAWFICESRDDKGNAIRYEFQAEDERNVDRASAEEAHRNSRPGSRTANLYPKRILYGNRASHLGNANFATAGWLFEVVFDYGEGHYVAAAPDANAEVFVTANATATGAWPRRADPFSSYRSGFEVRTYRLCQRILTFHRFDELLAQSGAGGYLVRATQLVHRENPFASVLESVTQSGYVWDAARAAFLERSLPPMEFTFSEAPTPDELAALPIREISGGALENAPAGLASGSQWVDLDGEGVSGMLTEANGAWYFKPNLGDGEFGPVQPLGSVPATSAHGSAHQLLDLSGDGTLDVVEFGGTPAGFYERDGAGWSPFRAFIASLNLPMQDPNVRFVDLNGDGFADVMITEQDAITWYPSLGEEGFGPARRMALPPDESDAPRVVFNDGTQTILLADMTGDGLSDICRVRNGSTVYWPNLGHGRFGARVTMANAPWFDTPDRFDARRLRLADIDGSGVTDILYLGADGADVYYNESGNRWSDVQRLAQFPRVDDLSTVSTIDLLGTGTACLVWASSAPAEGERAMRYIDLMDGRKPHLLIATVNNLGAETRIAYRPSTHYYLADKKAGRPWLTKLPFPVQVVDRIEIFDRVARNRLVTRFAYHDGCYDGIEREFRGFGMVEQWDSEFLAALAVSEDFPVGDNIEEASYVPPVLRRTWYHTGIAFDDSVSNYYAGLVDPTDRRKYYREPGLTDAEARELLLADTVLPPGLSVEDERAACRALRGRMLRQELYAFDGTTRQPHPYIVVEHNFLVRRLQERGTARHAVFFTHAHETLTYHYERNPADPRIVHTLTLEVDEFGNVRKEATVAYGRRANVRVVDAQGTVTVVSNPGLAALAPADQLEQTTSRITYTEQRYTEPVRTDDAYRNPLPGETSTYELTNYVLRGPAGRLRADDVVSPVVGQPGRFVHQFDTEIPYEGGAGTGRIRRPIERVRTLYRSDDLTRLLPLGEAGALGISGESFRLALTPGLIDRIFRRRTVGLPDERLLPDPRVVLAMGTQDGAGYAESTALKAANLFPSSDPDAHWWQASGRIFFSRDPLPDPAADAVAELNSARQNFFQSLRFRDPFGAETRVMLDGYALMPREVLDPNANVTRVTGIDYRTLQPREITDPNGNRSATLSDALGMIVATAVMGKAATPAEGDSLAGVVANLPATDVAALFADPLTGSAAALGGASTRVVHDVAAYFRTRMAPAPRPPAILTLSRHTHVSALAAGETSRISHRVTYSDGFNRIVQEKIEAERDPAGAIRWVGSGTVVFNNKGKPVREYEPFFTATHAYERGRFDGVSPIVFYDPVDRIVAKLQPDRSYEKVRFDAWSQVSFDANDTVAARGTETGDPRTDPDIRGFVAGYFRSQPAQWQTWFQERLAAPVGSPEREAAIGAAVHANTPAVTHQNALGHAFLQISNNRYSLDGNVVEEIATTRTIFDVEGNARETRDALGRAVVQSDFDMLGGVIREASMESGTRWMLADVAGKPVRRWDSRGHTFTFRYDQSRRLIEHYVRGSTAESDPRTLDRDCLIERFEYGESIAGAADRNLRTRVFRHFDSAGVVTYGYADPANGRIEAYDFKGNVLRTRRQLVRDVRAIVDWNLDPELETESFLTRARYDAMNRPVQSLPAHSDRPGAVLHVVQPTYNAGNLLERIDVWLARAAEPAQLLDRTQLAPAAVGVVNIDYDPKGQRRRIDYSNGTSTFYGYDDRTFRLRTLYTRRAATFTADCDNPTPPPATIPAPDVPPAGTSCGLQNLFYTYDPVGNVTRITDRAQQTLFFRNRRVEPSASYIYDANYRLIEATGREHLGQLGGVPIPHSHDDAPRVAIAWSANDGNAVGSYVERFVYDAVGSILEMQHRGTDPANPGWTRRFEYLEPSLLESARRSNRLTQSRVGTGAVETYSYDSHGNMRRLPQLGASLPDPNLHWDYRDQLLWADLGGGGIARYVYDASGQRVRKVIERRQDLVEERLYFTGVELYRRRTTAGATEFERETLHVMDGKQRVALVERRTIDTAARENGPSLRIRYQLGNHLGSSSIELDEDAELVSYEEYSPYGSTTYQAVRGDTVAAKRYRYVGKERDDETGFYYYGARYYAPWLARWVSCDPSGIQGGINLYGYCLANPIKLTDPSGFRPKLTTWLLTGGEKWEASQEEIDYVTADMRRSDVVFNPAAGYGALVGIVGVFEGTALLGYDVGRVAFYNDQKDNDFVNLVNAVREEGLGVIPKGIAHQAERAANGDAVAFGELAFGAYTMAEGATSLKVTPKNFTIPPILQPAEVLVTTTVTVPVVEGGATLALGTMLMQAKAPSGGGQPDPIDAKGSAKEWEVRRHKNMPSPRPDDMESHHGIMSAWMKKRFPNYKAGDAPAILMSEEAHNATRGVFNKWRTTAPKLADGKTVDWAKISEAEIRQLSDKMLDAAKAPQKVRTEYYRQLTKHKAELKAAAAGSQ